MVPHSLADDNSVSGVSQDGGVVSEVRGGVDSVGEGGGVSHKRGVVSNGVNSDRGVVGGGGVGGLGMGLSLISHVGNKSVLVIGVIRDNLDTTVRELHSVLS